MSADEIAALVSDRLTGFANEEQALVRLADALSATPVEVGDQLYAELRSYFSEEALIELGADIAQENYRARWNRLFDIGSDELYCELPRSASPKYESVPKNKGNHEGTKDAKKTR